MGIRRAANIKVKKQIRNNQAISPMLEIPTVKAKIRELTPRADVYGLPVLRSKDFKRIVEGLPGENIMGPEILHAVSSVQIPTNISLQDFFGSAARLGGEISQNHSMDRIGPNGVNYKFNFPSAIELHAKRPNQDYVMIFLLEKTKDEDEKEELLYSMMLWNEPKLPTDSEFVFAQELFLDFLDAVTASFA